MLGLGLPLLSLGLTQGVQDCGLRRHQLRGRQALTPEGHLTFQAVQPGFDLILVTHGWTWYPSCTSTTPERVVDTREPDGGRAYSRTDRRCPDRNWNGTDAQGNAMKQRLRRVTDLFVRGREVELPDGTCLWVQAINAYERDECVSDAQVARARIALALKENGTERLKIDARLIERGRGAMEKDLVQAKIDEKYPQIVSDLEDDPDWTERGNIIRRTDFNESALPADPAEREYLDKVMREWTDELERRVNDERDWLTSTYHRASDETLLDDYTEAWLDRRGGDAAAAEYSLTEMWYATRHCDATKDTNDTWDHSRCNGHPTRVFDTKNDTRSAPDELQRLIRAALLDMFMATRDPKDSAKPPNSSDSSPTPNEAAASTPSTSTETPQPPPGTSPQP